MIVVGVASAAAAAGVWVLLAGGGYRSRLAVALFVVAGLIALLGGTVVARAGTSDVRAFLGQGPERDQPDVGGALQPMGVFLFVCLPLAAAGLLLAG